jgi:hypothetical protein
MSKTHPKNIRQIIATNDLNIRRVAWLATENWLVQMELDLSKTFGLLFGQWTTHLHPNDGIEAHCEQNCGQSIAIDRLAGFATITIRQWAHHHTKKWIISMPTMPKGLSYLSYCTLTFLSLIALSPINQILPQYIFLNPSFFLSYLSFPLHIIITFSRTNKE